MKELTADQRLRYARNIAVPAVGVGGQQLLLEAKVMIVGCGALGSVVASYLVGAGVGTLYLADFDTIDISNLQRQTRYCECDAGKSKVETLAAGLRGLNGDVNIVTHNGLITRDVARRLFAMVDFVVDATDNPDTKYMIDEVCVELGKPYSMAGVLASGGQVMTHVEGTARYSDFFPQQSGGGFTPCSIGGILGPVAGVVGSIQALEVIKYFTGTGRLLTDRLLHFDGQAMRFTQLHV